MGSDPPAADRGVRKGVGAFLAEGYVALQQALGFLHSGACQNPIVSAQRIATQGSMPVCGRALYVHLAPRCPGIIRIVSEYADTRPEP